MKFLRYSFKPEFSWFETLALVALLALDVGFVIFLFAAFILGMISAAAHIYFEKKGESL